MLQRYEAQVERARVNRELAAELGRTASESKERARQCVLRSERACDASIAVIARRRRRVKSTGQGELVAEACVRFAAAIDRVKTILDQVDALSRIEPKPGPDELRPVCPLDSTYRIYVAPHERSGGRGVDSRVNALVFEHRITGSILSAPVGGSVTLDSLSAADLFALFGQASIRDRLSGDSPI